MSQRFTNSSPGALTMAQAIEREKKRAAEHRRQVRQARELAAQGRGSDTEVAHVARGEIVVPVQLQSPHILAALSQAASAYGVPLEMLKVGDALNRINPNTGAPEFGVMDWISGLFGNTPANTANRPPPPGNQNLQPWPQACDAAKSGCIADANMNSPPGDTTYRQACTTAWDDCNAIGFVAPYPASKIVQFPDDSAVVWPPNSFDAQYYPKYLGR